MPLFGPDYQYVLEGFQTTCSFDLISQDDFSRTTILLINIFGYFLPIIVICCCFAFALIIFKKYHIKKQENSLENFELELQQSLNLPSAMKKTSTINNSIENFGSQRNNNNTEFTEQPVRENENFKLTRFKTEWQLTKNAIIIIFWFCLLCLPYTVCSLIAQFADNRKNYITPFTIIIATSLAKISAVINPLIVIVTQKKYRKIYKN